MPHWFHLAQCDGYFALTHTVMLMKPVTSVAFGSTPPNLRKVAKELKRNQAGAS